MKFEKISLFLKLNIFFSNQKSQSKEKVKRSIRNTRNWFLKYSGCYYWFLIYSNYIAKFDNWRHRLLTKNFSYIQLSWIVAYESFRIELSMNDCSSKSIIASKSDFLLALIKDVHCEPTFTHHNYLYFIFPAIPCHLFESPKINFDVHNIPPSCSRGRSLKFENKKKNFSINLIPEFRTLTFFNQLWRN